MSAPRGPRAGGVRGGRGRGSSQLRGGKREHTKSTRGAPKITRGGSSATRGRAGPARNGGLAVSGDQGWRSTVKATNDGYSEKMHQLWQKLKTNREKERKDAIRNGLLADPEKPTSLANAITPVGTCQEMCPEYERVERIVQLMVDGAEKIMIDGTRVPCEEFMVKRFRRSAAGYDEQLPSDIRPPIVLQKSLNYLLDEVVGGTEPLAAVHKFVWDRTRGIRNDFSIQQVSKTDDLKIAIDCFERIARFHLLSLHQLSNQNRGNGEFDHHQEREQLNNTLLSLMYYYDDSRRKLESPNEAEFRAYCIIFEIQDQRPDLEDRAQNWPLKILADPRVKTAMKLYAAAGNTTDQQGPLRPKTSFATAQMNYGKFWSVLRSEAVSYLMACAAEIYFNLVRGNALGMIYKAYKRSQSIKLEDLTLADLTSGLGYDNEDQTQKFCEEHGLTISERDDGESYLDLRSVQTKWLDDSNDRRKQVFSQNIVECKRGGRTLTAVVNGSSIAQSRKDGLVQDSSGDENDQEQREEEDSLFVEDSGVEASQPVSVEPSDTLPTSTSSAPNPFLRAHNNLVQSVRNPFAGPPSTAGPTSNFGMPSTFGQKTTFQQPSNSGNPPVSNLDIANRTVNNSPSISGLSPLVSTSSSTAVSPAAPAQTTSPPFQFQAPTTTGPSATHAPSFIHSTPTTTSQPQSQPSILGIISNQVSLNAPSGSPFTSTASVLPVSQPSASMPLFSFKTAGPAIPKPPSATAPLFQFPQIQQTKPTQAPEAATPASFPAASTSAPVPLFQFPQKQATKPVQAPSAFQFPQPSQPITTAATLFPIPTSSPSLLTADKIPNPQVPKPQISAPAPFLFPGQSKQAPSESPLPRPATFPTLPTAAPGTFTTPTTSRGEPSQPKLPRSILKQPNVSSTPPSNSTPQSTPASVIPARAQASVPKIDKKHFDDLATDVMLGEDGLMEQIVRHITGPIIRKSIERVERERRRAEFAKRRSSFLFIKYFSLWRKKAWAKNLRRRGQQFRLSMAESMKALHNSQRNSQTSSMASSPDRNQPEPARMSLASSQRSEMPPPTARPSQHKRSSLPADVQGNSGLRNKLPVGSHVLGSSSSRPTSHRTPHSNHKRSKTSDGFLKSTLSGRLSKTIRTPNSASSMYLVPDDTAYATETLMRRAKHLVRGRTDTTKGDYFRLKAHGLDPDTPVVPLTKKRSRPDEIEATPVKTARRSLSDAAQSSRTPSLTPMGESKSPTSINGSVIKFTEEEEELFAQARELKEALAEGERWFREEREKHERSRSNSLLETDKERKLRELLRDNTPSRTQLRLEATGAHGLWKGRSGGNGGSGKRRESSHMDMDVDEPPKLGLAALTQQANGGSRRAPATNPFGGSSSWGVPAGASADDAIEL